MMAFCFRSIQPFPLGRLVPDGISACSQAWSGGGWRGIGSNQCRSGLILVWRRRGGEHVSAHRGFRLLPRSTVQIRFHQVRGRKGNAVEGPVISTGVHRRGISLCFRASEPGKSIPLVRSGYQTGFSQIVFRLQVLHFGAVGSIYNTNGDGENGVTLLKVSNRRGTGGVLERNSPTSASSRIASSITS